MTSTAQRVGTRTRLGRAATVVPTFAAATLLFLLAACGSDNFGDRPNPGTSPGKVEALSSEPRVDLPGRVSVFLRVTNGDGSPAAGLVGSDFNIYENDQLVSQTESSQRIIAQPQVFRAYLHLVIDRSNSVVSGGAQAVEDGAREFIQLLMSQPQNQNYIKISWFDGSPDLHPIAGYDFGFSNDVTLLLAAVDALNDEPPFSTSTNLYGAVVQGIEALDVEDVAAAAAGVENRALALVTFTDGTHQAGPAVTLADALDAINGTSPEGTRHGSFTIGVGAEFDANVLSALGISGTATAADFSELEQAFLAIGTQIAATANSFYFLSYCSPKTSGMNSLRISVLDEPNNGADARFMFDATYFGGGCAFFDVRNHPDLAAGADRVFVSDAIELPDGSVAVAGWRSADCLEPGCGSPATAFVAKFQASDATATGTLPDGQLDATFGNGGFVDLETAPFEVSGASSLAYDAANGEMIVGGWARASATSGFVEASLWTVDMAGANVDRLDLPNPGVTDQAVLDLESAPGGGFVAAGYRGIGSRSFAVWRLLPDLILDPGFGASGVVYEPAAPEFGNEGASDVVVDGSRVYAVGRVSNGITVLALDALGARDTLFGGTGIVEARRAFGGETYAATAGDAALDASGNLVVAGTLEGTWGGTTVRQQPAVWRIDADGFADTNFRGSMSSPTFATGVVTLRAGSTSNPDIDFGRDTRLEALAIGPDGTILASGQRMNAAGHTDLAILAFDPNGVSESDYNFLGFAIDDGASADDSFECGTALLVLDSGAIWTLGVSNPEDPAIAGGTGDVPTIWVDRDSDRAFPPLGQ